MIKKLPFSTEKDFCLFTSRKPPKLVFIESISEYRYLIYKAHIGQARPCMSKDNNRQTDKPASKKR